MKSEWNKIKEDASCENNLRFCAEFQGRNSIMLNDTLKIDCGEGFDDRAIVRADIERQNEKFRVLIDWKKKSNCRLIRWNPVEKKPIRIVIDSIKGAKILGQNAYRKDKDEFFFLLGDSFFYFVPIEGVDYIEIKGEVAELDVREQRAYIKSLYNKEKEQNEELRLVKEELELVKEERNRFKRDLDSVVNSTIWRKTEFLRRLKDQTINLEDTDFEDAIEKNENQTKSIDERIRYCIDEVEMVEGRMSVDGWVFCENAEIDEVYLILTDIFGYRRQYPLHLEGRKDVAMTLNVRFVGGCGFHFVANYKSFCAQKIVLKVLVEGEWHEIFTNDEIPPCDDAYEGDFFLEIYNEEDAILDYCTFKKNTEKKDFLMPHWKVDIIVPVYNGMKYLPTLFFGMEKTSINYRLILVEDCSSDLNVLPYLREYASKRDNVTLLENDENLGFVKSVNRALKLATNHVVLVNTDVELPNNWLERLMRPIFENEKVASATPYSNSATIFSFPDFDKNNRMFLGLSVDEIDKVFCEINPSYTEVPTGVGFCMGMSINAIHDVGIFDEETFEKGYGEENDWCQRAIEVGYKNVYVENLFVYHNHGGSFSSETKERLMKENTTKLIAKHPHYIMNIESFCKKDPNKLVRDYAKFELIFQRDIPFVLAFDHDLGGGASAYLREKMNNEIKAGNIFGIIRYNMISDKYMFELYYQDQNIKVLFSEKSSLLALLRKRTYKSIWINELASYVEIFQWLKAIKELRMECAKELCLFLHDYFMICPSLNLLDKEAKYCRVPSDYLICDACLLKNDFMYCSECYSIDVWRHEWGEFMKSCDMIVAFSQDTMNIMKKAYPNISSIILKPHYVEPLEKIEKNEKKTSTINIGVLGSISEQKGIKIIKRMLEYIELHRLDMKIVIIGESSEEIISESLIITGRYKRNKIPDLAQEYDVDVFLIPSICPETFSYTTSEIMSMDMPITVFNLGAPAERVKDYAKGLVLEGPDMDVEELINELYAFAKRHVCILRS